MISYNTDDFNLEQIEAINGKFNYLKTEDPYYVYGLRQAGNPPIWISTNYDGRPDNDDLVELGDWLEKNDLRMESDNDQEKRSIRIGLRKDIRAQPKYAAALVRTFVAFFEGALVIRPNFKVPKVTLKRSRGSRSDV